MYTRFPRLSSARIGNRWIKLEKLINAAELYVGCDEGKTVRIYGDMSVIPDFEESRNLGRGLLLMRRSLATMSRNVVFLVCACGSESLWKVSN